MKSKFESMDNDELDPLLAEMMGWEYIIENPRFHYWKDETGIAKFNNSLWNPTDKDSAQLQRYVFPRLLKDYDIEIDVKYERQSDFEIKICKEDTYGFKTIDAFGETGDPDKINRTIAICCLEAFEKINTTPTNEKGE